VADNACKNPNNIKEVKYEEFLSTLENPNLPRKQLKI
jgi:hypothetical protein